MLVLAALPSDRAVLVEASAAAGLGLGLPFAFLRLFLLSLWCAAGGGSEEGSAADAVTATVGSRPSYTAPVQPLREHTNPPRSLSSSPVWHRSQAPTSIAEISIRALDSIRFDSIRFDSIWIDRSIRTSKELAGS